MNKTRRNTLKGIFSLAALSGIPGVNAGSDVPGSSKRKGNVNHSVCRWCYQDVPLEELCMAAKASA